MAKRLLKNENHPNFELGGFHSLLIITMIMVISSLPTGTYAMNDTIPTKVEGVDYFLPKIDLTNWKVTLPIPRPKDGKAQEVEPPDIYDYATNALTSPYMYNDSTDGSIVFYALPGSTTANTKYSRCELREQMEAGSNNVNWTFAQGGRMRAKLAVTNVAKEKNHSKRENVRVIVAQIHGRLTNEQKALIGAKDNNAPPILKIYWVDGKILVKTKYCTNKKASYEETLFKFSWDDDEGYTFNKTVGNQPFTLEVVVSEGKMEVILDDKEKAVYKGKHMEKWGIFENYFKVGNYLQSKDLDAFAYVKLYELEVEH